jgi:hypothetical protein
MLSALPVTLPEVIIRDTLNLGVAAISANTALLDDILYTLPASDKAKCRAYWATNPPVIVSGYARAEGPFPVTALTLMSEDVSQEYTAFGDETYLDLSDERDGRLFKRRLTGTYALHIYAEHPDVAGWYYRVMRRILNVGAKRMIAAGLHEPRLSGAELLPEQQYAPDQLFIRRLTLTVEYEEVWSDRDSLAVALTLAEEYLSPNGELLVRHIDVGGGVDPG